LVDLKPKSAGDGYPKKAIEKTVLRFLGSRTFSHGLAPQATFAQGALAHPPDRGVKKAGGGLLEPLSWAVLLKLRR